MGKYKTLALSKACADLTFEWCLLYSWGYGPLICQDWGWKRAWVRRWGEELPDAGGWSDGFPHGWKQSWQRERPGQYNCGLRLVEAQIGENRWLCWEAQADQWGYVFPWLQFWKGLHHARETVHRSICSKFIAPSISLPHRPPPSSCGIPPFHRLVLSS